MLLIILLVILLVVLLSIDFYRKAIRQKEKQFLKDVENKNREEFILDKSDLEFTVEDDNKKPSQQASLLDDGFIVMYYEPSSPIKMKDLNSFMFNNSIKMLSGVYQRQINRNVIFSILADNEKQLFESAVSGEESKFILVMNFRKVISQDFNVKSSYEDMMDLSEQLQKNFGGVLLNENGLRVTKKDKQKYLTAILNY